MADDTIQTIKIGLGIDTAGLRQQAKQARADIKRELRDSAVTVTPLLGKVPAGEVAKAAKDIANKVQAQLKAATTITPKFTVTKQSITQLRRSIDDEFKQSPIRAPIEFRKVTTGAIRQARRDMEAMWNSSPVRVPLTWYWKDGPPPTDLGVSGKGGPQGGGTGGAAGPSGPAAGPAPQSTRAERREANKAAWAQRGARGATGAPRSTGGAAAATTAPPTSPPPPTFTEPAPLASAPRRTGQAAARPARQAARQPRTTPAGTQQRVSMDELRGGHEQPISWNEFAAAEAERARGTFARQRPARGVRTGSRAGNFITGTPDEIANAQTPLRPDEIKWREIMWDFHEQLARRAERQAAAVRHNDPAWQRAQAFSRAINSVKRDPKTGTPDISEMEELLGARFGASGAKLAGAYQALLLGQTDKARAAVSEAFERFGAESGVKRGKRKLIRALDPESAAFNKQPADVQLFGGFGSAIRSQASILANPDVALKKKTVTGRTFGVTSYNKGLGFTKTAFDTDKDDVEKIEDEVKRSGGYLQERLKPTVVKDDAELGIKEIYTTGGRRLRVKEDPETGVKTVLSESDERAKDAAKRDRERLSKEVAKRARRDPNTPSPFAGEVDESLRPGPLAPFNPATFGPGRERIIKRKKRKPKITGLAEGGDVKQLELWPGMSKLRAGQFPWFPIQKFSKPGSYGTYSDIYAALRPETFNTMGSVSVFHNAYGDPEDIFPFVEPQYRRRGIASKLYEHIAKGGVDIEALSNRNASEGGQTEEGSAFWQARKRRQGWTNKDIRALVRPPADPYGKWDGVLERKASGGLVERLLAATLDASGAIKPGMEARSQQYNQILEQKRGGWKGAYLTGERGVEWYKSKSGKHDRPVGLRGPEIFTPPEDGEIIPHHKLPGRASGGPVYPFRGTFQNTKGRVISEAEASRHGVVKGYGEIARVYVVNFPAAFTTPVVADARTARADTLTRKVQESAEEGEPTLLGTARSTRQTPLQTAQAKLQARETIEPLLDEIGDIRSSISEQLQLTPVRALSVSIGQIFQTAFGGRAGILARSRIANRAAAEAQQFAEQQRASQERASRVGDQLSLARTLGAQPEELRPLEQEQAQHLAAAATFGEAARQRAVDARIRAEGEQKTIKLVRQRQQEGEISGAEAEQRIAEIRQRAAAIPEGERRGVATRTNRLQAQALGLTGIVVGTIGFTAAMHAAQLALDLFGKATSDGVDRLTGWNGALAKASAELAVAAQAVPGAPQAGLAAQYARLGVTGEQFPLLGPFATRLAGAQNLQTVIGMMRAESNLRAQVNGNPNVVPGIGTGFGNGPLAFLGGGLGWLGQTPGALEQLGGALASGGYSGSPIQAAPLFGSLPFLSPDVMDTLANKFAPGTASTWDPRVRAGIASGASALSNLPFVGGFFNDWSRNLEEQDRVQKEGADNFASQIDTFNDRIYRSVGDAARLQVGATKEQLTASIEAFRQAGNKQAGEQLARQGIAVVGAGGAAATADIVNMVGDAIVRLLPSRAALEAAIRPQLAGQLAGISVNAQRQREQLIPTQLAMQLIARPQLAPSTGLVPTQTTANITQPGVVNDTAQAMSSYVGQVARYQQMSRELAQPGYDWLAKLSPEAQEAIGHVRELGQEIAAIRQRTATIQTNFANDEWLRQQDLALRQAGDMVGLLGEQSRTVHLINDYDSQGNAIFEDRLVQATELGRLQRDQLNATREQQRISFQIEQRDINFQRALAQIEVPGRTPGEQQAYVDAAERHARERQEAHDRAVDIFERGITIENIQLGRQANDFLNKDLPAMFQGHYVNIEVTGGEAAVTAAQDAQNGWLGFADSFKSEMEEVESAVISAALSVETQMNAYQETFASTIDANLAAIQTKYPQFFSQMTLPSDVPAPPAPVPPWWHGGPGGEDRGGGDAGGGYATGSWRTGNELAMLHAGEMVIPANQAAWMRATMLGASVPASSGGGNVQIVINNPVVRDESDIDKIARRVEEVMNRRAVSVGLVNN